MMENDAINPDLLVRLWRKKGRPEPAVRFKNQFGMQCEILPVAFGELLLVRQELLFHGHGNEKTAGSPR